jgi:hypothetical protein
MFGVGPTVFAVWGYVISHTRKDGFTELNPQLLGAVIGCPPEEIETAIDFLCSPDERSRSKDEDGRRMIREGEFDYRVVNYTSYRNILNEDERRAYNRLKKRESRARQKQKSKGQSLTVNEKSTVSAHTDEDVAATPSPKANSTSKEVEQKAAPTLTAQEASTAYNRACTVALNTAMAENTTVDGEWMPVTANSQIDIVEWYEYGIPLEVAETVIRERCLAYRSSAQRRGPRSLRYFDAAVRESWERGKMSAADKRVEDAFE